MKSNSGVLYTTLEIPAVSVFISQPITSLFYGYQNLKILKIKKYRLHRRSDNLIPMELLTILF